MIFSKVESGIVTAVVNVTNVQWIQEHVERYGDSSLYVETDAEDFTKLWGRVGYTYDSAKGLFSDPDAPVVPIVDEG
jgi:hypothetical protein